MIKKILFQKSNHFFVQLFRYGLVGGVAFIVDMGSLVFFTDVIGIHYLISAIIAFIFGLITNYILSIHWVFNAHKVESKRNEFMIFALIGLVGLALNELIIWGMTEGLHVHYTVSKLVSTGLIYFWNFLARRKLLF